MVFLPGGFGVCFATLFAALAWRSAQDITLALPVSTPQTVWVGALDRKPFKNRAATLELPLERRVCVGFVVPENPQLNGPADCTPVLRVFLGWVCLFFAFIFFQSAQKFAAYNQLRRDAKKTDDGDRPPSFGAVKYGGAGAKYGTLTGDRTVGNMLEQAVPFLLCLYLHATVIDVQTAAKYGWCWLLSRAAYPFVFSKGLPWLFISTLPGYAFIGLLAWPLFQLSLAFTIPFDGSVSSTDPLYSLFPPRE